MQEPSVRALFDAALDRPAADRAAFLSSACADQVTRRHVEALLAAHDRAGEDFLGQSAIELVGNESLIGHRIGPYELVSELGRGGMGVVFLAVRADDSYRKRVAVKLVNTPFGSDELVRRFVRERQILAGLEHHYIARLLDGGATPEGLPYLVMEYVDGVRIDEFCRQHTLGVRERLALFLKVCDAVQFAHTNLVVHRDLKPQNILVTADGTPRLLDFGVAALLADDGSSRTTTSLAAFTPQYASPEQLTSERVTTASDVYSLGVLLYELLTDRHPYDGLGRSPVEVLQAVTTTVPIRPSLAVASGKMLRGDLDTITLTALQKSPERRYRSAAALAADIDRYLTGHPVLARADSVWYRTAKLARRHRMAVAAAALVVATLVGGVIVTARQARIAVAERHEAELQRARAERRFGDVRRLANSFLFEFHDAIATLPGATPARQLVVAKALEYLDSLASEAASDRALQAELAAAYDKVGDVQGNQSGANLGDVAGALASYSKALAIRQALVVAQPGDVDAQLQVAMSAMKVGDAHFGRGAVRDAVAQYRLALAPREAALVRGLPSGDVARSRLIEVTGRLCTVLLAVGDVEGAIGNCHRNGDLTAELIESRPSDIAARAMRATSSTALGNALRLSGQFREAEAALADAASQYREILTGTPNNADLRRRLAVTEGYLANAYADQKKPELASASLERAVAEYESLAAADPSNARVRTELAYVLTRRATVLLTLSQAPAARRDMSRALDLMRAATTSPGAGGEAFNEYAWALATCEPADLRRPAEALRMADEALRRAGGANPIYQHTRAWALFRLGRRRDAVAALEGALSQLAPAQAGPQQGVRRQMEADLASFKSQS